MNAALNLNDSVYAELLAKLLPRPIRTGEEHARLTTMLLQLDEREDLTPEEEALAEVLTLLIEDYEEKYHPLPSVAPHESLKALMEERGLKHKDIWPVLGNKGAATERSCPRNPRKNTRTGSGAAICAMKSIGVSSAHCSSSSARLRKSY
ncbi:MAG: hypothetical protein ABSD56_13015 [Bryobacteraceae bacterium]